METNRDELREALAAVADTRAAAADRLVTPLWYHPVLGFLQGSLVIPFSLAETWLLMTSVVVFALALGALVSAYRRQTGVWVSGIGAGRASRWSYAAGALAGIGMVGGKLIASTTDLTWPVYAIAATVAVVTVILGIGFDRALRAYLRGA